MPKNYSIDTESKFINKNLTTLGRKLGVDCTSLQRMQVDQASADIAAIRKVQDPDDCQRLPQYQERSPNQRIP